MGDAGRTEPLIRTPSDHTDAPVAHDRSNRGKHRGIAFPETTTVFADPLASTFGDSRHSVSEERFVIIGQSHRGRCLIVMYTVREEVDIDQDPVLVVNIISARRATSAEISAYEEAR